MQKNLRLQLPVWMTRRCAIIEVTVDTEKCTRLWWNETVETLRTQKQPHMALLKMQSAGPKPIDIQRSKGTFTFSRKAGNEIYLVFKNLAQSDKGKHGVILQMKMVRV